MTANLLHIPQVLTPEELGAVRDLIARADWQDGGATAGHLSASVKRNRQLAQDAPIAQRCGAIIGAALNRNAQFMSAALPARIVPPLFNRYGVGETYGAHIDGAIRHAGGQRIRTDLSATVFLTPPDAYDGGELSFSQGAMMHGIKLAAGDMLLYPANTIHQVMPVTRGERLASFLWVQSIVRAPEQRQMLYDLDQTIQQLTQGDPGHAALLPLTGHYHNLVRMWAEG